MITKADLHVTPILSLCNYGLYSNVKYMGHRNGMVLLEDRYGNPMEVYESLFFKYGTWLEPLFKEKKERG